MRTTFRTRQPYSDIFLSCANSMPCNSPARPDRFIETMRRNRGGIAPLTGMGLDDQGLERKNPVIVGLGDSVTAGRFESLVSAAPMEWLVRVAQRAGVDPSQLDPDPNKFRDILVDLAARIPEGIGLPSGEISDATECYLEKFRQKLIDRFEETSVSTINAGLAGDTLIMMERRLERDVIRYQPDLVLINGSLNWSDELGSTEFYKELLTKTVRRVKSGTDADIVLLTPNGMAADDHTNEMLAQRVRAIRQVAAEETVCLADTYAVWEEARRAGCPWTELLANGMNHPGVEGHEVYAITLMKLLDM